MLDILKAASELYGDCSRTPPSTDIYIGGILATAEQMIAIMIKAEELQAEYDSKQYARDRAAEYAALNQFEMQFDDQVNGTTTWVDAINDIKARFPK